jgi:hypothetical protein
MNVFDPAVLKMSYKVLTCMKLTYWVKVSVKYPNAQHYYPAPHTNHQPHLTSPASQPLYRTTKILWCSLITRRHMSIGDASFLALYIYCKFVQLFIINLLRTCGPMARRLTTITSVIKRFQVRPLASSFSFCFCPALLCYLGIEKSGIPFFGRLLAFFVKTQESFLNSSWSYPRRRMIFPKISSHNFLTLLSKRTLIWVYSLFYSKLCQDFILLSGMINCREK